MAEPYQPGIEKKPEEWPPYVQDLQNNFEDIDWMAPIVMTNAHTGVRGLGCRICIAWFGIVGDRIKDLPINREEHEKHLTEYHGL